MRRPCSRTRQRTSVAGSQKRLVSQPLENSVCGSRIAQALPPIEFPFPIRAILIDVMEEQLRGFVPSECVSPVSHFGAAIQHAVAGLELDWRRAAFGFKPHGPDRVRLIADANRHAHFARRSI